MRRLRRRSHLLTALALALATSSAAGRPLIVTQVKHHGVEGDTGAALVAAMDRKGPRQGFMTHAIAQTVYSLSYGVDLVGSHDACRVQDARVRLELTYIYPQPVSRLSAGLERRWRRFMAGVRRHEEAHGRMAREMAGLAERTIRATKLEGDGHCRRMKPLLRRKVSAIYAEYDDRQNAFDRAQHRAGGHVDALIADLVE
jgi:predicted secreted Zn-dependent protease